MKFEYYWRGFPVTLAGVTQKDADRIFEKNYGFAPRWYNRTDTGRDVLRSIKRGLSKRRDRKWRNT